MIEATEEDLVAVTTVEDSEVCAFVKYMEWMKSTDYTDFLLDTLSDSDRPAQGQGVE